MKYFVVESKHSFTLDTDLEHFHGTVLREKIPGAPGSPHLRCSFVRFEKGARTKVHYHAGGQVLLVTKGEGFIEFSDGKRQELRPDMRVVVCPGEIDRHGAAPDVEFEHIAITAGETFWWSSDAEH